MYLIKSENVFSKTYIVNKHTNAINKLCEIFVSVNESTAH